MRILVANPFGIGDVLFSLPLVRALRRSMPAAHLSYLCNRRTEELAAHWPELDEHLVFEKDEFRAVWRRSKPEGARFLAQFLASVRRKRFDLLVDLSLGWHLGLAGILCGIPRRIGFNFRRRGKFLTSSLPLEGFSHRPVPEYYLDLLELLPIPRPASIPSGLTLPKSAAEETARYLEHHQIGPGTPLAAIVPGGGASWGPNAIYKQWPPDRFARVADHLARRGLQILLIGDAQEASLCAEVGRRMSAPPQLTVQVPSLLLLAGLLKRCRIVVGNDGGTLHLATAVGTPSVSVFGPVDPSVYGPYPNPGEEALHRVVSKELACRPCYKNFRFPPCPWDNACLKQLDEEPVLQAVDELLR